ncbi:hypothetical protein JQC67_06055 [Aurantibacter crassamenti]|uniref:hypothetical protein n=1 Tax=Aurantibacter crassamenti TaxID=1837375 RepID=UPI00193A99AC|nr:hypothetical protein [Aurantibacter crassamenti]MBM1105701.1 hypothetical protein [Aurantibacter crassamenti]
MKTTITVLLVCFLAAFSACNAQSTKDISTPDTLKQMNLLDEQIKMYGQVFTLAGMSDDENPTGGADNYLEMVENMDVSEELKEQIREMYDVYDTSLDPTKKEELKIKVSKMLNKGVVDAQSE